MKLMQWFVAIALGLGLAGGVWADGMPQVVSATTATPWTRTVYNDSGSALTSGTVVVWDTDDTEFDETFYPYVTTTTSADSDWVAGVMLTGSCAIGSLCEIVTHGPAWTLIADSTDAVAEDTGVSTSSVAGMAGDYGPAANTCMLGVAMSTTQRNGGADSNADGQVFPVFVNPTCQ